MILKTYLANFQKLLINNYLSITDNVKLRGDLQPEELFRYLRLANEIID